MSEHVHLDSFSDDGISYNPELSAFLDGDDANKDFSRIYLGAELSSLQSYGVSSLLRKGHILMARCGKKIFPYRLLSNQERGFLSPDAHSERKNDHLNAGMKHILSAIETTSRSLFFICGDFDAAAVKKIASSCAMPLEVLSEQEFHNNLDKHLTECSLRSKRVIVVSASLDSIAMYSFLRRMPGFDLTKFMLSFGGLWACAILPKLCPSCRRIKKIGLINYIEHGVSFRGNTASAGPGCSACLRGYSGASYLEELISAEHVERYFQAIQRFEHRFRENTVVQPLVLTSEYAATEPRLTSIYQALSIAVLRHEVSVEDATILLL